MPVHRTILDHPDFPVPLNDLGFDFPYFLVDEDRYVLLTVKNGLARFNDAIGTQRVGHTRPTERGLGLLPRFQERLIGPFWRKRGIWFVLINYLDAIEKRTGNRCDSTFH